MYSVKKVFLEFGKFAGKSLCQGLCFDKVAGQACSFIKIETLAQVFSCEFCEISKNTFSWRTPLVTTSLIRFIRPIFYVSYVFIFLVLYVQDILKPEK